MDILTYITALANGATVGILIWTFLTLREIDRDLEDLNDRVKRWGERC